LEYKQLENGNKDIDFAFSLDKNVAYLMPSDSRTKHQTVIKISPRRNSQTIGISPSTWTCKP
jgi:hypothetical protein